MFMLAERSGDVLSTVLYLRWYRLNWGKQQIGSLQYIVKLQYLNINEFIDSKCINEEIKNGEKQFFHAKMRSFI